MPAPQIQPENGGGWTQIASLDFSVDACPGDWQPEPALDMCSRQSTTDKQNIRTAPFDNWCIPYTGIRGNLVAYQNYSTDAFGDNPPNDIDQTYMDGISFTLTDKKATVHLFSYGIGFMSGGSDDSNCPSVTGGAVPHDFVGSDYLCDSGNLTSNGPAATWYDKVPLFETDWFQVSLDKETDSVINGRLIATMTTSDEDVGVGSLKLLVR